MRTRSIAAGLLLALYLVLLARRDLDERLPGGWKAPAALLILALLGLAAWTAWRARAQWPAWRAALTRQLPWIALGAVTLVAAAVRVFGAGFGLPYLDHPDEPAVADRAIAILQTGDFNPHYFVYPNLYTYLEAGVFAVHFLLLVSSGVIERLDQIRAADFYLWGRLLTVALGTLTVPLVYLAGRRLYGVGAGLIAAGLLALNNLHAQNSQFITVDVPVTFFTALALWLIARLLPRRGDPVPPGWGRYLAAGVAMGLAVGTKYQAGLILLPFLVAHGYAAAAAPPGRRLGAFLGGRLWLALGALGGAFLLTTPFALLDLPHFLNDVASALAHYRYGHLGFEGDYNWRAYVPQLYALDPLPTLLGVAGVVFATLRHRPADLVLVSFPLALYFQMSGYRVIFVHNLLPLLPFTTILAAGLVVAAWRLLVRRLAARPSVRWTQMAARAALLVVLLLVIWPGASAAAQRDYRFSRPDTRTRAAAWLDAHTPPGTKIWMEMPAAGDPRPLPRHRGRPRDRPSARLVRCQPLRVHPLRRAGVQGGHGQHGRQPARRLRGRLRRARAAPGGRLPAERRRRARPGAAIVPHRLHAPDERRRRASRRCRSTSRCARRARTAAQCACSAPTCRRRRSRAGRCPSCSTGRSRRRCTPTTPTSCTCRTRRATAWPSATRRRATAPCRRAAGPPAGSWSTRRM